MNAAAVPLLTFPNEITQEHDSIVDATRGGRRMERSPPVDAQPSPQLPAGDEAAVRPWQHPPPPPPPPPSAAEAREAARPWTYLRPPSEQVALLTAFFEPAIH